MIVFPNCKINLGLNITRKRADGYHDLETVFLPLPLFDMLEAVTRESMDPADETVHLSVSGVPVAGKKADNLCVKAYDLLKRDFPAMAPVSMHLHKTIPAGAGLGGGSADGAFAVALLDKLLGLQLTALQLSDYALALGSDCPFFLFNQPCLATGRGENIRPVSLNLAGYKVVLVNAAIPVPTAMAFSMITPQPWSKPLHEIIEQPVDSWKQELVNDFEPSIFRQYPEIQAIKNRLYEAGAVYASMSGSGSTVFGLFGKEKTVTLDLPDHYFHRELAAGI